MSYSHRTLIEHVRKANKLLSLYVLALQEDAALQPTDHAKLVGALRMLIAAIEERAESAAFLDVATNSHSVIESAIDHDTKPEDTATGA